MKYHTLAAVQFPGSTLPWIRSAQGSPHRDRPPSVVGRPRCSNPLAHWHHPWSQPKTWGGFGSSWAQQDWTRSSGHLRMYYDVRVSGCMMMHGDLARCSTNMHIDAYRAHNWPIIWLSYAIVSTMRCGRNDQAPWASPRLHQGTRARHPPESPSGTWSSRRSTTWWNQRSSRHARSRQ